MLAPLLITWQGPYAGKRVAANILYPRYESVEDLVVCNEEGSALGIW